MLDYQVKYWANMEQKRSNLANEDIARRRNELQAEQNRLTAIDVATRKEQNRINQQIADTQRYAARQQAITNRFNAEVQRDLAQSTITSAGYNNLLTRAKTDNTVQDTTYKQAQIKNQHAQTGKTKAETVKTFIETQRTAIENALRPKEAQSQIIKNYSDAYKSLMTPITGVLDAIGEIIPF